jgi:hypothetical protein
VQARPWSVCSTLLSVVAKFWSTIINSFHPLFWRHRDAVICCLTYSYDS